MQRIRSCSGKTVQRRILVTIHSGLEYIRCILQHRNPILCQGLVAPCRTDQVRGFLKIISNGLGISIYPATDGARCIRNLIQLILQGVRHRRLILRWLYNRLQFDRFPFYRCIIYLDGCGLAAKGPFIDCRIR